MWHRVAKDVLHCTVEEAQRRLTSLQFARWCAYFREEPWGHDIENFRAGTIAATVANVAPREKGTRPLQPSQFFPARKPEPVRVVQRGNHSRRRNGQGKTSR